MARNNTTKKSYDAAEIRIVDLFRTTDLNRKEIASVMKMTGSEVGYIIHKHHAVKGDALNGVYLRPEGFLPCMLTLKAWPRCYGNGCHWVSDAGDSECPSYNAMQNKSN